MLFLLTCVFSLRGQSNILTMICTWNEAAILPKNLSQWFTMRSEEALWALCPWTDSLNPRDLTLVKSLIKHSAVVSVPHFPRSSHCCEELHSVPFFFLPLPAVSKIGRIGDGGGGNTRCSFVNFAGKGS